MRIREIGVGLMMIVAFALLGYMSLQIGAWTGFSDSVEISVRMRDAAGLSEGALVAVAGVPVGTVQAMWVEHDQAVATLFIDPQAKVRDDVSARIRARSLLGEKYVELRPGRADAPLLADGAVLVIETEQVEIDEMVNAVGPLLAGLQPERMGAIVERLDVALAADPGRLVRWGQQLDIILEQGAITAEDLPELVGETRAAVADVRRTLVTVERVAAKAEDGMERLHITADSLNGTLLDAPEIARDAHALIRKLHGLVDGMEGTTEDLATVLDNLSEIDKVELRRLLREEGILVRLRPSKVVVPGDQD